MLEAALPSTMSARPSGTTWLLAMALSLLPLAYLIAMCHRLFVDVPFADQWELVWRLERLDLGNFSFRDLWGQHNEHRPLFPLLVTLGLAEVTRWNLAAEIATNVALGIGIFAVCARHGVEGSTAGQPAAGPMAFPIIALLVFSPVQWENWLWGWQIEIFMGLLASTTGWWLVSRHPSSRWTFFGAIVCGIVTTYSFAAGLPYWIVGVPALWLHPAHRTRGRMAAWIGAGALTIGSTFIDYHFPGRPPILINFVNMHMAWNWLAFIGRDLGAPVALYSDSFAAAAGFMVVVAFTFLLLRMRRFRHDAVYLFPLLLGLHAVMGAVLTGLGRAPFSGPGLVSRYTSAASLLWVAVVLLGSAWLAPRSVPTRELTGGRIAAAALAVALCVSVCVSARRGVADAEDRRSTLRAARTQLIRDSDSKLIGWLYNNDLATVKQRRGTLVRLHMWVFRNRF
jgi:hypothetical protein